MPTDAALRVLHDAAEGSTPDAKDVFEAIRAMSKAKPSVDYAACIPGPGSTMRHWQLLFTANGADLNAANAGKPFKCGNYWPTSVLPACSGYSQDGGHENGVYIASGALSLRFAGLYDLQSVRAHAHKPERCHFWCINVRSRQSNPHRTRLALILAPCRSRRAPGPCQSL